MRVFMLRITTVWEERSCDTNVIGIYYTLDRAKDALEYVMCHHPYEGWYLKEKDEDYDNNCWTYTYGHPNFKYTYIIADITTQTIQ